MGDSKTVPDIVRVTVDLPGPVWDALVAMADREGVTKTEMFRRAISAMHFISSLDRTERLMIESANGDIEEVVFPW
jgi:hypothetical protein